MHPIASFVGQFVGGCIAIYLLAWLAEWAIIKRIMDDSAKGWLACVAIAYIVAVAIYGWGHNNGQGWTAIGIVTYLPSVVAVGLAVYIRRKREANREFL